MAVRFDAVARQTILAATIEAEKHGRSRPVPRDLLVAIMSLPESSVPGATTELGAEARTLLAAAAPAGRGVAVGDGTAEDAERILRRAGDMAAARGGDAEIGILDILAASLPGAESTRARPLADRAPHDDRLALSIDERKRRAAPRSVVVAGIGYDSHRFGDDGPLVLGGVTIPESVRLVGHSDGDAIAHAITDAVLGAAGAGDIGEMFSDRDPANRGRDSLEMLRAAVERVAALGFVVHQVDATVVAEQPKIATHRHAMKVVLASALGIDPARVSVKGKTNEGMGWVGRGEGIACIAVATLTSASSMT